MTDFMLLILAAVVGIVGVGIVYMLKEIAEELKGRL